MALSKETRIPLEFIESVHISQLLGHSRVLLSESIQAAWKMLSVLISAFDPKVRLKAVKTVVSSGLP